MHVGTQIHVFEIPLLQYRFCVGVGLTSSRDVAVELRIGARGNQMIVICCKANNNESALFHKPHMGIQDPLIQINITNICNIYKCHNYVIMTFQSHY